MNLNNLTNEEILMIYFSNKLVLDRYNKSLEIGSHRSVIEIFDLGSIVITTNLTEEDLEDIRTSEHYNLVKKMNDQFEPISEMIYEADPSLYNKINEFFIESKEEIN